MRSAIEVPIAALQPSDSPRIDGESDEHIRRISETDEDVPPIVVHRSTMRVVDGMHRLQAAVLQGKLHIEARLFDGTEGEAFVLSVWLNTNNGLPLSRPDRMAAVRRIVDAYPRWSDQAIATVTGVSDKTVAVIRRRAAPNGPGADYRVGRDGRRRPLNMVEGRLRASSLIHADPDVPLREVAKKAKISLGTAVDVRRRVRQGENPLPKRLLEDVTPAAAIPAPRPDPGESEGKNEDGPGRELPSLRVLLRDPALRFHREGKVILRLMHMHMRTDKEWDDLLDGIPVHCRATLAKAAHHCSRVWQRIAERLEG
ncbi:ParB/RepB/Spo0J family partition protein [Amycolatopsis sp. NPDC059021]|uniref:ParB/RepB/Spo0J family partition protein n=1 Tax=Amycolatopsis sp. NPDC059021 TaxID=3346704 RepID=UPI00367022CB